jgi:type III secretion protein C
MRSRSSVLSASRLWCSLFTCALAFFLLCVSAQAANFRTPFSYYADGQSITTVLRNFAQVQGYNSEFSPEVKGTISGRFSEVAPSTFLKGMQNAFDVKWYELGRTLYFYNAKEVSTVFLSPRIGSASQLYNVLKQSGVFSPQLPAKLNQAGDVISVSGPPSYLSQIRSAAAAFASLHAAQIASIAPCSVDLDR